MAVLIPALSSAVPRMTTAERHVAERLERKLDADYVVWYDVPVGPKRLHPDFVVLHPRRGLLILEVKDWRLETIQLATKLSWEIAPAGIPTTVVNPLEQARYHAHQVVAALTQDPQLVFESGKWQGMLTFPWSYGVVLTQITRQQFEAAELGAAIDAHRVVCSDEIAEATEPEALQSRLWGMFPLLMRGMLSLPQVDRIRWILFPEVRISNPARRQQQEQRHRQVPQTTLDAAINPHRPNDLPEVMTVMDVPQELLARSLSHGHVHHVVHGVAGSGKTMLLCRRAEQLAADVIDKPVLLLCISELLADKLAADMATKGLAGKVQVQHFHAWVRTQLATWGQPLPSANKKSPAKLRECMANRLIGAVGKKQVPSGQYMAVLIDEGHDFEPEWLTLATQMVDPETNCLLAMFDGAQSVHERARVQAFSFKRVGIQAQGHTTVLRVNYRNTRQILHAARQLAGDLLINADENGQNEDAIPLIAPLSCGRDGPEPIVIELPSVRCEAIKVCELLCAAHEEGHAWKEMAVLCGDEAKLDEAARVMAERMLPHQICRGSGTLDPDTDTAKVMTIDASKGLEFGVVALMRNGQCTNSSRDQELVYVATIRAITSLTLV